MTCRSCQRLRRVIGIRQVPENDEDGGPFPDGLTIPQKILHLSAALVMLAVGIWIIWLTGVTLAVLANWAAWLMVGITA